MTKQQVGFIGLGRMGRPMASNMQRKGVAVTAYDILEAPRRVLSDLGASAAASVAEVAERCDIIFTVLPADKEVEQVMLAPGEGILANARAGTLVVDMSTINPLTTDKLAAALADSGMTLVDAPIGRLASHADAGECLFMVGASDSDFATVKPLLETMGTTIHHCGPVGSGMRTKLINNYLAITSCQMNAEALTLAQAFGLQLDRTLEVIHGTTATNGQLKINYATKVLADDTEPGFQIDLAHKDLSLVLDSANAVKVPMTLAAAARESLSLARSRDHGGRDFSGLLDALCEVAGVDKVRAKN